MSESNPIYPTTREARFDGAVVYPSALGLITGTIVGWSTHLWAAPAVGHNVRHTHSEIACVGLIAALLGLSLLHRLITEKPKAWEALGLTGVFGYVIATLISNGVR
jgi:hypothetical protein